MIDLDSWIEIFHTIKQNKLRTFLTGFSVAWGIFMLIVLLAAGNGLKNGVMSNFGDRAVNSVQLRGGRTSMEHLGMPKNKKITLTQADLNLVETHLPEADKISARVATNARVNYGEEWTEAYLDGVHPAFSHINGVHIQGKEGRFINEVDIRERRKVAVINSRLKEILFKDKNPIGKQIIANQLVFTVIGVYEDKDWGDQRNAYIPFSTAQTLFSQGWGIQTISFTTEGITNLEESAALDSKIRKQFAGLHQFNPEDEKAIRIWNRFEDYTQALSIFGGINLFVLIIGGMTLVAGVVGVSNIMLISVKERTKEFGIQKALGAKPLSILRLVLLESLLITGLFGYLGMVSGIALSEAVNWFLESSMQGEGGFSIFKNPTVTISIAAAATLTLVLAGLISGLFPAYKAVKITAVEAMRSE